MKYGRVAALAVASLLVVVGCSDGSGTAETATTDAPDASSSTDATASAVSDTPTTDAPTTEPATTDQATTSTTSTTEAPTTTVAPTTTIEAPTTTVAPPAAPQPGAPNPACIVVVKAGDSLNLIAGAVTPTAVDIGALQTENGIADPDVINVGASLDVCPGNGIDDVTGAVRVPPTTLPPAPPAPPAPPPPSAGGPTGTGAAAQQEKLNALFGPYGYGGITVDGDSGRRTEQALCAARVALGLPVNRNDMEAGGAEEQALMGMASLPVPPSAPTGFNRWAFIDKTCQVMFVGQGGSSVAFVFPISTGQPKYETRLQDASAVFRYDPARENGGWHDSIDYPAAGDNPLNGNMYKPLYFDNGQAIHGANSVPSNPASHGCVRVRVGDQDALIDWLGLHDAGSPIWKTDQIGLTVRIVGSY